jgi:nitroreductase
MKDKLLLTLSLTGRLLKGLWCDIACCTGTRIKHCLLRLRSPEKLADYQLMSLLFWHSHQTEKATKHKSRGRCVKKRGWHHYQRMSSYLGEVERRGLLKKTEEKGILWSKDIKDIYEEWVSTEGRVNVHSVREENNGCEEIGTLSDQVSELICSRRSVRIWQGREVPDEIIEKLLACGMSTSSSCNRQGVVFVFVKRSFPRETITEPNNSAMLKSAPLIVYLCCDPSLYPERFSPVLDVGMAAEDVLICANSTGLKGCAMYQCESFDQDELRRRLGISKNLYVYMVLLLGYPAEDPKKPARMSASMRSKIVEE